MYLLTILKYLDHKRNKHNGQKITLNYSLNYLKYERLVLDRNVAVKRAEHLKFIVGVFVSFPGNILPFPFYVSQLNESGK